MDDITLRRFREVVQELDDEFDSHAFIFKFMQKFEAVYIGMLQPVEGGFQILDSWFGRTLLDCQAELEIQKEERESVSLNVKGNITSCALWKKQNRNETI